MDALGDPSFLVSWGDEVLSIDSNDENAEKHKFRTKYSSFHCLGKKYCITDVVYLYSGTYPPYIARIADLYEDTRTKEKKMLVRYFCRPSELPAGLPGVDYNEKSKEIFMSWGKGSKEVVDPGSTIGKCMVVCTAQEKWNSTTPSIEQMAAYDHFFSKAFSTSASKIQSLHEAVEKFGEEHVTGVKQRYPAASVNIIGSGRKPVELAKKSARSVIDRDPSEPRKEPLVMREASGLPSINADRHATMSLSTSAPSLHLGEGYKEKYGPDLSKVVGEKNARRFEPSTLNFLHGSRRPHSVCAVETKKRPRLESLIHDAKQAKLKRPKLSGPMELLKNASMCTRVILPDTCEVNEIGKSSEGGAASTPISQELSNSHHPAHGIPGSCKQVYGAVRKTTAVPSFQGPRQAAEVGTVQACASGGIAEFPSPGFVDKIQITPSVKERRVQYDLADRDRGEPSVPMKKIFNMSWQRSLQVAIAKRQALLLQNLDPLFSSSEIEDLLHQLLRVNCDVRMLPPKDFSSYISGEAVVVFQTSDEADGAFRMLTENVVTISKDERPVVATIAEPAYLTTHNPFHGFLNVDRFSGNHAHFPRKRNVTATSHCAQGNTAEYEMGIKWRLLQNQHTEAWALAAQLHKDAIDKLALRYNR